MTLEEEPVVHCVLTWPVCQGNRKGISAINHSRLRMVQMVRRRWEREVYLYACLDLADRRSRGHRFSPWRVQLDTCVTLLRDDVLSLWQEEREQWGNDIQPKCVRWGDTWSLKDGTYRTLASFFSTRDWKKQVLAQVTQRVQQQLASGESLLDADCESRLIREFEPEHFYLTEEGAEIFYPMCSIAAAGEGIPTFPIILPST